MIHSVLKLLDGKGGNYILPFFWQHGEDEDTLRKYMGVIHDCGIGAVCVESRPHPDFCGEKWWKDMDVILEEAKRLDMKVWILDDSHFPTGYANGALKYAPEELCRQGICYEGITVKGGKRVTVNVDKFLKKKNDKVSFLDVVLSSGKQERVFSGDTLLSITAVRMNGTKKPGSRQEIIDLTSKLRDGKLTWTAPDGLWKLGLCKLSRNCGAHRNYINMMNPDSCRLLLEHVYEPHFTHYKDEFGTTIAGFFSDEPELGNGKMYSNEPLGADQDLPWDGALEPELEKVLGTDWKNKMPYLWEQECNLAETARIRFAYMDAVTRKVGSAFSGQIGEWCENHGVEYIGHVVEDNNSHARTGGSLGHYFRGLAGMHMAGIDNIGGQVLPHGEDGPDKFMMFQKRDGEFYHYVLGKLGSSLAAIDKKKKGRTMCEIFGNYGWSEGLRLERFLADHFMVNGVNRFVPHAFSAKPFPDPDCPPHFYAHGHNPQYRHFRSLMEYMNRVCELIDGGNHIAPVAILYHAEAEWTGKAMLMQKPARKLLDAQIDFDILPMDVFRDMEDALPGEAGHQRSSADYGRFCSHAELDTEFRVNTQSYKALVIPCAQFISRTLVSAIEKLLKLGIPVIFVDSLPKGFYEGKGNINSIKDDCLTVPLEELAETLRDKGVPEILLQPSNDRIRYLHYKKETDVYYFINEGTEIYKGIIELPQEGEMYAYHAWDNVLEIVEKEESGGKSYVTVELEPLQSLILVFDKADRNRLRKPLVWAEREGSEARFAGMWKRSICESTAYPKFYGTKQVSLPDRLAEEQPKFSGWVRYENTICLHGAKRTVLTISDAYEGVEVFVNGKSAGIQVAPTYRFDISKLVREGKNTVVIEVSTTLERERAAAKNQSVAERMMRNKVLAPTGITGVVRVFEAVD
ncbi:MAG: hypothetical protein NC548_46165 [Lachnospiraceae bacterium]|nr:hypothetical protein [Lachnospiraceae bacterium]